MTHARNRAAALARAARSRTASGFTLVEMLIVVAIVGLLAGIALPNYHNARRRAQEAVLAENLWTLRHVIDQYYTDRGQYPPTLDDLELAGYVRRVPIDPMTGAADWITDTGELGEDPPDDPDAEPGISDVHSAATGVGLDGKAYSEW